MARLNRLFRRDPVPGTEPKRTGPGSVTGRKASGVILASQVDDWVPQEAAAMPDREAPRETSPSDWLPPDLPEPTSSPPPPERKRSTVNQVPPEMLAAAKAEPAAAAPQEVAPPPAPGAVDLNAASLDDLMRLPGVTRRAAEQIAEHRPFGTLDDLTRVPGFHAERVARLAAYATV